MSGIQDSEQKISVQKFEWRIMRLVGIDIFAGINRSDELGLSDVYNVSDTRNLIPREILDEWDSRTNSNAECDRNAENFINDTENGEISDSSDSFLDNTENNTINTTERYTSSRVEQIKKAQYEKILNRIQSERDCQAGLYF